MASKKKVPIEERQCVTPEFRVSFPHVFEPRQQMNSEKKAYELDMLFSKGVDLTPIKKIVKAAIVSEWGEDNKAWPKNLRYPFRDGDEKSDTDGYPGNYFIKAKSEKTKPQVLNQKKELITDPEDFPGGCYARAFIQAYAYDQNGNRGVGIQLIHLQKTRKGEPFSGGRKAAIEVFDELEIDEAEDETAEGHGNGAADEDDILGGMM